MLLWTKVQYFVGYIFQGNTETDIRYRTVGN